MASSTVVLLDQQSQAVWEGHYSAAHRASIRTVLLVGRMTPEVYREAIEHGMIDAVALDEIERLPQILIRENADSARFLGTQAVELRTALENMSKSVILIDPDTTIRLFNQRAYDFNRQFYGIETKAGMRIIDMLPEQGQHAFQRRLDQALAGQSLQFDMMSHDRAHDFAFEFHPVMSADGQVIAINLIYEDISQRKAIERQSQLYASVYQNITDAVIVTDLNYMVVTWNPAAEKLYGWRAEEVIGNPVQHYVQTQFDSLETVQQSQTELFEKGSWESSNLIQHHRDGTPICVSSSVTILKDSKGVPHSIVACNHDITELHNAEQSLRETLERERELNNLKTRFVSMASHEFRTPLATILTAAETVAIYRHRMIDTQIDERLDRIRRQVLHMTGIIDDVLQLTRMGTDHVPLKLIYADFAGFCRDILVEIEAGGSENRRVTITGAHAPIFTYFDQRSMRQAITNVISNALKYSTAETQVELALRQGQDQILLDIHDHGIGIPSEDIPHLFEPFHRAGNVGAISGTGLGLSITKQAISLHGGEITIQSVPDQGTTVTLMIPVVLTSTSFTEPRPPPMG